jgi:hypothetical protein
MFNKVVDYEGICLKRAFVHSGNPQINQLFKEAKWHAPGGRITVFTVVGRQNCVNTNNQRGKQLAG